MVDSIVFSEIDLDSIVHEEFVVQEFHTPDSIYRIPIASIDSVGFQKPGTIYEKDVIQLNGNLFDYLISEDSMSLTFDAAIPSTLLPKVGDKLATVELSDKLPFGFAGLVREVKEDSCGYIVSCDTLQFEEVMYRFYGINEIVLKQDEPQISSYRKTYSRPFTIKPLKISSIKVDLINIFKPKDSDNDAIKYLEGEPIACATYSIETTKINGRVSYVIDKIILLSHYDLQAEIDLIGKYEWELGGKFELSANKKLNHIINEKLLKNGLGAKGLDFDFPLGFVPIHLGVIPKFGITGELATIFTHNLSTNFKIHITHYPFTKALIHPFNTIKLAPTSLHNSFDWEIIAGNLSFQTGITLEVGIGNKHFWGGVEGGPMFSAKGGVDVDFEELANSQTKPLNTKVYDTFKDECIEWEIFTDTDVLVNFEDMVKWKWDLIDIPKWTWGSGKWDFLPKFAATRAIGEKENYDGTTLEASTLITNDCIIPYTVGFTLFDNEGNKIGDPQWRDEKFKSRGDEPFVRYAKTWNNVETGRKYHVYPTLKFFNFDVLASPKDDIAFGAITTLDADAGINTATMRGNVKWEEDHESIFNYGIIYGTTPSLTVNSGTPIAAAGNTDGDFSVFVNGLKDDTKYYYRAYLRVGDEYFYAEEVKSFKTKKELADEVDLGLSVNWRSWNVGATKAEEDGNYFAWGETEQKEEYTWQTYFENPHDENDNWVGCATTTDITGSDKDAATVVLGEKWRTPTSEEMKELMDNCTWKWTTMNEVNGYMVESNVAGYVGNYIFLPAAGNYDKKDVKNKGSYGGYWTSTPLSSESKAAAYNLYFYGETILSTQNSNRYTGRSIRPVCEKPTDETE
jgi:hypothetical protein